MDRVIPGFTSFKFGVYVSAVGLAALIGAAIQGGSGALFLASTIFCVGTVSIALSVLWGRDHDESI